MSNKTTYVNNKTQQQSKIVDENDTFYIMDNGDHVLKSVFMANFTPLLNEENINPTDFMSQKPHIETYSKKNDYEQKKQGTITPIPVTNINESNANMMNQDTEIVDPSAFMNTSSAALGEMTEQIKNIDVNKIPVTAGMEGTQIVDRNQPQQESNNIQDLESRKQQALAEYYRNNPDGNPDGNPPAQNQQQPSTLADSGNEIDPETGLTKRQMDIRQQHMELSGEDPFAEKIQKYKESKANTTSVSQSIIETPSQNIQIEKKSFNPMFDTFKKCHKVNIDINLVEKISQPEFIKMVADNLEGDIIEYYTDGVINKIINNIDSFKEIIYNQLYEKVYGCLPPEDVDEPEEELVILDSKSNKKDDEEIIEEKKEEYDYSVENLTESEKNKGKYLFYNKNGDVKEYTLKYATKNKLKPYKEDE